MSDPTPTPAPAPAKKKLRLGVRVSGGKQWIAGVHYLSNIFQALRSAQSDIELVLWAAWETDIKELQHFKELAHEFLEFPSDTPEWQQYNVGPFLKSQNIDCMFATADYGDLGIPQLSWLFDFQHKEMPEMFPEYDLNVREEMFQLVFRRAELIVLSSKDAARACRKFYPEYADRTRVMPFMAHIPDAVYNRDPALATSKYNLPEKFIFVPNQMWKHKNHVVVLDALERAMKLDPSLTLVCSGATEDPRDPYYVPYLRSRILSLNYTDNIRLLGLIPEDDVFSLMRSCVAILQPSLYEGWSTVVEQARSLGKPILLSDIAVHKEQNPDFATFFAARNADELAHLLLATIKDGKRGPDLASEAAARQATHLRSVDFGRRFQTIVEETIAVHQRRGNDASVAETTAAAAR